MEGEGMPSASDVHELEGWIEQLYERKPLAESDVKKLCEKVCASGMAAWKCLRVSKCSIQPNRRVADTRTELQLLATFIITSVGI